MLYIPIVHADNVSKQIPQEKFKLPRLKCYETIGSCVSCAFIEISSTWDVWRPLKELELLSATPQVTLTHLSCSPNFPRASYLDECTLTHDTIVNFLFFFVCFTKSFVYPSLLSKMQITYGTSTNIST